jgi:hypothetical protein
MDGADFGVENCEIGSGGASTGEGLVGEALGQSDG